MTKNIANPELAIRHEPGGLGSDLAASASANGRHLPIHGQVEEDHARRAERGGDG